MLNISSEPHQPKLDTTAYTAFSKIGTMRLARLLSYFLLVVLVVFVVVMFLPWTQTISAKGKVTTLTPDARPQSIHSILAGRIERWYVREGQAVRKGDTICYLSEVKADYFDPRLVERSDAQIHSKEAAAASYRNKVGALDNQLDALTQTQRLKLEQLENKVQQSVLKARSDSLELIAAETNATVAAQQYVRQKEMYKQGLKSLTDLEQKETKMQETAAKRGAQENKYLAAKNELLNARIEQNNLRNEYAEKVAKTQSDRFSALAGLYDAEGGITKLENVAANYAIRAGLYYVLAPQDCYITKLYKTGIGEIVKEGDELVIVAPISGDKAVDMYVDPVDLPLLASGQRVRFTFDGFASLVVAGWQRATFGTFGGVIVNVDNTISDNGKYRVLVQPDPHEKPWAAGLRLGTGAQGIVLLHDVPIWYELWRKLNAFPPDFYEPDDAPATKEGKVKLKAPIKNFK